MTIGTIIDYHKPTPEEAFQPPVQVAFFVAGAVAYMLAALALFLLAVLMKNPHMIALLPAPLLAASAASSADPMPVKCMGRGAIVGAVLFSTVGYALGILLATPA